MRFVFLLLCIAGLLFASCSAGTTDTEDLTLSRKKVRVKEMYYSAGRYHDLSAGMVQIKYVDTSYRVGDIVKLLDDTYQILE